MILGAELKYKEYRYGIKIEWNGGGKPITIPQSSVIHTIISHDYIKNKMPVIYFYSQIPRELLDMIIKKRDESTMILTIEKFEWNNNELKMGSMQKYLSYEFMYFVQDDINYRRDVDSNPEDSNPPTPEDQYIPVLIGLILEQCVSKDRAKIINNVFTNCSVLDLILYVTSGLGKLLLEPPKGGTIENLIIPPNATVSELIQFINNKSAIYDTAYRYYIDFDRAYLLSSKGTNIQAQDEKIKSVIFNINNLIPKSEGSKIWGNVIDGENYICDLDATMTEYYVDKKSDNIYNKIVSINPMGEKSETEINLAKTKTSTTRPIVIKTDNLENANTQKQIIESSKVLLKVVKSNIDSTVLTMNKEYNIVNFDTNKEFDGKYLLVSKQEIFTREQQWYNSTTSLLFKKIF